ncbi:MAG: multicomponent Na+:H+ antiporter subunit E [Verrucomicrobiales bacterium]|jgi:multicomponent Na+:H+ antiporter subunit E
MARRILIFTGFYLLWIAFMAPAKPVPFVMGAICCALVTWISGDLLFVDRERSTKRSLGDIWRFLCYCPWLLKEVVAANFHVLRLVLSPGGRKDVNPRIVRYKSYLKSDIARFVFANSITLTPGTITMVMDDGDLYIHAISEFTEKGLEGEMEDRIAKIFGETKPESTQQLPA